MPAARHSSRIIVAVAATTAMAAGCHIVTGLEGFGVEEPPAGTTGTGGATSTSSTGGQTSVGGSGGGTGGTGGAGGGSGCVAPGTMAPCTGEVLRVRVFSAAGNGDPMLVRDLDVDDTGAVYVAGEFYGQADLGFGLDGQLNTTSGYALKLDAALSSEWRQIAYGVDYQTVRSIDAAANGSEVALSIDFEGEVIIEGFYFDNLQLNVTDALITKLDGNGVPTWARHLNGTGWDRVRAVAMDAQGQVAFAGYFYGELAVPGAGTFNGGGDGMSLREQAFVGVRQADGNHAWLDVFGVEAENEGFWTLASTGSDFFASGYFDGSLDLGLGPLQAVDNLDAMVARFSFASGPPAWQTQFSGDGRELIRGLAPCPNGDLTVGGMYESTLSIGNNQGTTTATSEWDAFWARLDAQGSWLQSDGIAGSRDATFYGNVVACGPDNRIVVGGAFDQPLEYGGATPVQGTDGFVSKLDLDGAPVWTQIMPGTGDVEVLHVKTALDGTVVVAGHVNGAATIGGSVINVDRPSVFVAVLAP